MKTALPVLIGWFFPVNVGVWGGLVAAVGRLDMDCHHGALGSGFNWKLQDLVNL